MPCKEEVAAVSLAAKLFLVEPFVDMQNAANQRNRTRKPAFFEVCSPKSENPATFAVRILRIGLVIQRVGSLLKSPPPF
ncbi:hypothetical protein AE938_04785 [Bacteroides fragilis]|nr:hypothetical protein [Bacteroides fragilis]